MEIEIREIQESDNQQLASIIRHTLKEFKADKPGTVYYDKSTDHLCELFQVPNSIYYVALVHGEVVGGAGIYPTEGLPSDTVELVKMYLKPEARGKGLGKTLIMKCIDSALENGYSQIYLETMAELEKAVQTYNHLGFRKLTEPMGSSGHHSCEIWMLKSLSEN